MCDNSCRLTCCCRCRNCQSCLCLLPEVQVRSNFLLSLLILFPIFPIPSVQRCVQTLRAWLNYALLHLHRVRLSRVANHVVASSRHCSISRVRESASPVLSLPFYTFLCIVLSLQTEQGSVHGQAVVLVRVDSHLMMVRLFCRLPTLQKHLSFHTHTQLT